MMRVDRMGLYVDDRSCPPGDMRCKRGGSTPIGGGGGGGSIPFPWLPLSSPDLPPVSSGPQCTPENPGGIVPPIGRPERPGGGRCACTCRAGNANVGGLLGYVMVTAVARSCPAAAAAACTAAINRVGIAHMHHVLAKCSDGSNRSGSGGIANGW